MRARYPFLLWLLLPALSLSGIAFASVTSPFSGEEAGNVHDVASNDPAATVGPVVLNYNLGAEPPTIDPAKVGDMTSFVVANQLFLPLVDLDESTGMPRPKLASSWEVSPDSTVFTFTLRSDAFWSDGNPVTAADARFGILRSLDPATGSPYAYALAIIKNAAAYASGTVTDTDQVGVTALDPTHLRITFEYPASYALAGLTFPAARPMPSWPIAIWGDGWTDPARIVTNGAYRLAEWVRNDHILLEKNPTYFDAANVQIDRAKMWMVSESLAWTMYLDGRLDTARVPSTVTLDPVAAQERRQYTIAGTYYYGFSTAVPPFGNPLVRKAFAAASDRAGLVASVNKGVGQPALTFTAPGVFGHVDGFAEGVGIPYSPAQARQYLADAGYPNGVGLPPVTLWYNSGSAHQAIATYLREGWYATLGVSVTLQSLPFADFLNQVQTGQFPMWRMGWIADYPDANDFHNSAVLGQMSHYGTWNNPTYTNTVVQAAREPDPATRRALYKQSEQILVQEDAMMNPCTITLTFKRQSAISRSTFRLSRRSTYRTGGLTGPWSQSARRAAPSSQTTAMSPFSSRPGRSRRRRSSPIPRHTACRQTATSLAAVRSST